MLIGEKMYKWATDLFRVNRSITGPGVRETLTYLSELVHGLEIKGVPSGTKVFDWTVPKEWKVRDAYIITPTGKKICEFKKNNEATQYYGLIIIKIDCCRIVFNIGTYEFLRRIL